MSDSNFENQSERYGNPELVTLEDYLDMNPQGVFEVRGDEIIETYTDYNGQPQTEIIARRIEVEPETAQTDAQDVAVDRAVIDALLSELAQVSADYDLVTSDRAMLDSEIALKTAELFGKRQRMIDDTLADLKKRKDALTETSRQLAIQCYQATGNKSYGRGALLVKEPTLRARVVDEKGALKWVLAQKLNFVKTELDKTRLQAYAKSGGEVPSEFVAVEQVSDTALYAEKLMNLLGTGE